MGLFASFKRGQAVRNEQRRRTTRAVQPCSLHTHPPCTYQHMDVDECPPPRAARSQQPRSMLALHASHQDEGSGWSSVNNRAAKTRQSSVRDSRVSDRADGGDSSPTQFKHQRLNSSTKSANEPLNRPVEMKFIVESWGLVAFIEPFTRLKIVALFSWPVTRGIREGALWHHQVMASRFDFFSLIRTHLCRSPQRPGRAGRLSSVSLRDTCRPCRCPGPWWFGRYPTRTTVGDPTCRSGWKNRERGLWWWHAKELKAVKLSERSLAPLLAERQQCYL